MSDIEKRKVALREAFDNALNVLGMAATTVATVVTGGGLAAGLPTLMGFFLSERYSDRVKAHFEAVATKLDELGYQVEKTAATVEQLDHRMEPVARTAREAALTPNPDHLERLRNAAVNMFMAPDEEEVWFGAYLDAVARLKALDVKVLTTFYDFYGKQAAEGGGLNLDVVWEMVYRTQPGMTRSLFQTVIYRLEGLGLLEGLARFTAGSRTRYAWTDFGFRFLAMIRDPTM